MSVGTVEPGTRYRLLTGAGSGVMHVWDVVISSPNPNSPGAELGVGGEALQVADWSETYQASRDATLGRTFPILLKLKYHYQHVYRFRPGLESNKHNTWAQTS